MNPLHQTNAADMPAWINRKIALNRMTDLKPCPFCGKREWLLITEGSVQCAICFDLHGVMDQRWKLREVEHHLLAERDRLRAALEAFMSMVFEPEHQTTMAGKAFHAYGAAAIKKAQEALKCDQPSQPESQEGRT